MPRYSQQHHSPRCNRRHMLALPLLVLAASAALTVLEACSESKRETVSLAINPETFPTMRTTDVSTWISDSGYTRYHITAPLWLMFEEADDPHWNFTQGLEMEKFDNNMVCDATFRADTATYFSRKKIWRFDRNVRMRNSQGDRFVTQQLFWDQNRHTVYSDSFIHIERADRTIEGYGFISNDQMTEYTIHNPTGIFPANTFRHNDPTENGQTSQTPQAPQESKSAQTPQEKQTANPASNTTQ